MKFYTNKEYDNDVYFGSGNLLYKAIKKYGIENFIFGIIENVDLDNWSEKEKYWIKEMKSHISMWGYNQTWGGEGCVGYKWSDEQKANINNSGENNGMFGKKHKDESVKKISFTRKKNKKTSGTKNGMFGTSAYKKWNELYGKEIADKMLNSRNEKISINSKHTSYKRSTETINKLKISSKNRIKIYCKWCDKLIQPGPYTEFHGDNCKLNPLYKKENHLIICPHCNFQNDSILNMNRWHMNNCKNKKHD
jgi:group I intron endonuclease